MLSKKLLIGILALGMLVIVGAAGTFAFFDTSAQSQNNKITAGTLVFGGATSGNLNQFVTIAAAKPDSATYVDAGPIVIRNDGTLAGLLTATVSGASANEVTPHMIIYVTDTAGNKQLVFNRGTPVGASLGTINANSGAYTAHVYYVFEDTGLAGQLGQGQDFLFNIDFNMKQA